LANLSSGEASLLKYWRRQIKPVMLLCAGLFQEGRPSLKVSQDSGGGAQTSMEEGETPKHKNSLPPLNLQAHAALKMEAAHSELGATHG
jgi:hypothetical protein